MTGDREVAEAAADAAGAAIRPFFRNRATVDVKADGSPVSAADRAAEAAVRGVIAAARPGDGIEGEEGGVARPAARRRWIVDPIDGTRAFITGRPTFSTLIALTADDVPVLGVIDQPITGERWVGAGTTLFRGGAGVAGTRRCADLAEAELSCTSPAMFGADDAARFGRLAARAGRVSWGGDAYAYGLLALGQIDVIAEATMRVWDWAALVPVVEGAGGRMTDWSGRPLRPDGDGHVLAVGDPALLLAAAAALA